MYVYVVYTFVYLSLYTYVCMYVCMYVCVYIYIYICIMYMYVERSNEQSAFERGATEIRRGRTRPRELRQRLRSIFKMSCLFLRPRLWQFEIRDSRSK